MNGIKRHIKRNVIWFLLKFKKSHLSVDSEGDYSTVITAKVLFGDMYIMQTEWFLNYKQIRISKLEKEETEQVCHKVDKWDSEHRFYAFQNIGEISKNIWHIDESEDGRYPKCNVIKWFKTKEDVEYYLKNNKKSDVKKEPNFTYEDYQNASNDITYSQYPFWRG